MRKQVRLGPTDGCRGAVDLSRADQAEARIARPTHRRTARGRGAPRPIYADKKMTPVWPFERRAVGWLLRDDPHSQLGMERPTSSHDFRHVGRAHVSFCGPFVVLKNVSSRIGDFCVIPFAAKSETSLNCWNLKIMSVSSLSARVVVSPALVPSIMNDSKPPTR